jgi:thermostable 8-oxoguanine DNA glycosylase
MKLIFKQLLQSKYHKKVLWFFISIIIFSVIYSLLDASHFHGINPVQDKIKDDLVEKEAEEVKEEYQTMGYHYTSNEKQKLKQDVKEVVKEDDKKIENPTFFQNFFDRLYYSINTACLLGYGDIYPATNVTKGIVCIQSLITLVLILF